MDADERAELSRFRQALAIQHRRHWWAVYDPRAGGWRLSSFLTSSGEFLKWIRASCFPDPVTAVIESDTWFLQHVGEGNPEPRKD